jgi:hypothetical protein
MAKLSLRRLVTRKPREKKTLNPEMRKLLNSYEPLHPEPSADSEGGSDERAEDSKADAA